MFIIFEGPAFTGKTSYIEFLSSNFNFGRIPEWVLDKKIINLSNSQANDIKKIELSIEMGQRDILIDRLMFSTGVYNALETGLPKISPKIVSRFKLIEETGFFDYPILVLLFKININTGLKRGTLTNRYKESLIWYRNLETTYNLYYQAFDLYKKNNIKVTEIDASLPLRKVCFNINNIITCQKQ